MGPPKKYSILALLALLSMLNAAHAAPVAVSRSLSESTREITSGNHPAGHPSNPAIAREEAPGTDTRTFKERVDEIVALKKEYEGLVFNVSDAKKAQRKLDTFRKIEALEDSELWMPDDASEEGRVFKGLLDWMKEYQEKWGESQLNEAAKGGNNKDPGIVAVSK